MNASAATRLHCERSGRAAAAPLVLLHGWGMNLRVFDGVREQLGAAHAVTAIDLPGHGRSPWNGECTAAQLLAQLMPCIPRAATLIGWSLGGQLALQLAQMPSLAVRGLVLIATSPRFVASADWPHAMPAATLQRFAAQLAGNADQTVADFLELQLRGSANAPAVRASLQRALRAHGHARPEALRVGLEMLARDDWRQLARSLQVPALVIAGQYDRVTPPGAAAALAQLLPTARLIALRRAGHAPFLSHPQETAEALLAFLRADAAPVGSCDARPSA